MREGARKGVEQAGRAGRAALVPWAMHQSMQPKPNAKRSTLGDAGLTAGAGAYVFLHLALLVAYISKAAEILGGASGLAPLPAAALFAGAFGGLCFAASEQLLDRVNGGLVVAVLLAFFGLLASAAPGVDPEALLRADWGAVPATLPVVALSFVYHK